MLLTDRAKVLNVNSIGLLRDQTKKSGIERFFKDAMSMKINEKSHRIPFQHTGIFERKP